MLNIGLEERVKGNPWGTGQWVVSEDVDLQGDRRAMERSSKGGFPMLGRWGTSNRVFPGISGLQRRLGGGRARNRWPWIQELPGRATPSVKTCRGSLGELGGPNANLAVSRSTVLQGLGVCRWGRQSFRTRHEVCQGT